MTVVDDAAATLALPSHDLAHRRLRCDGRSSFNRNYSGVRILPGRQSSPIQGQHCFLHMALSDSFEFIIYRRYINKSIYLSIYGEGGIKRLVAKRKARKDPVAAGGIR